MIFSPGRNFTKKNKARKFTEDFLRPIAHEVNITPEHPDNFRSDIVEAIGEIGGFRSGTK